MHEVSAQRLCIRWREHGSESHHPFRRARTVALDQVHEGFLRYDNGDRSSLPQIADALVAVRYHARFLEQVEAWQSGKELEL